MAGYTQAGTWLTDDGRILQPQFTQNLGGVWYALDDKGTSQRLGHGFTELPGPPPATTGDTGQQPGGQFTTPDPQHPGYFYIDDPNVSGGVQRLDPQGNVVGTYAHPGQPGEGGWGWDITQTDPNTGGPVSQTYAQDPGGLFGLGDVWGSLAGVALAIGGGLGLGYGIGAVAPVLSGAAAGGAAAAPEVAGAIGGDALLGAGGAGAAGTAGSFVPEIAGGVGAAGAGTGGLLGAGAGAGAGTGAALGAGAATGAGVLGSVAPYAPLIGAGISGLGSIVGGTLQAGAAKNAAQTQADAANQANNTLMQIYNQNRADLAPYREAGVQALGQLQSLTNQPLTYGAYTAPAPLQAGQYPVPAALQASQYAFTPPSGQQVLNDDPGYQFRVSEGLKALDRQGSAGGTLYSGGQLKGAQRFSQDLASQEYQNAYNRSLTQNQMGYERAYQQSQDELNRNQIGYGRAQTQNEAEYQRGLGEYQTNLSTLEGLRNLRYNELAGISGTGQTATTQTGQLGAATGANVANNITSAGAAQAAGQVGSANAIASGIQGVGTAANSYLNYQLLNNLLQSRR